jgi:SH3-like domain-containing protein
VFKFNSLSMAAALALATSTIALPAVAADYRSVSVAAAVLWDGPSDKSRKVFVAPRGMPVEVISVLNTWVKVKDYGGDVTWMAGNELSKTRTVVATTLATARAAAQDTAALAFQAERGVTLELLDAGQVSAGFVRVKHKDGTIGFVKTAEVWGL